MAEVVYVLCGIYEFSREEIVDMLLDLIEFENLMFENRYFLRKALILFKTTKLDFVDSLLCAYSEIDEVKTFDKKLLMH